MLCKTVKLQHMLDIYNPSKKGISYGLGVYPHLSADGCPHVSSGGRDDRAGVVVQMWISD
jgi:hypothetical protein